MARDKYISKLEVIPEEEKKDKEHEINEQVKKEKTLIINPADLSDISMDFKKTPSFQNKLMNNYYENESEDLSMIKDIISHRSQ